MTERILVPLDGSSLGEAALQYVGSLLDNLNPESQVTVVLFHVARIPYTKMGGYYGDVGALEEPYTQEELEQMRKQSKKYLDRAARKLKAAKQVEIKKEVVVGNDPAEEIIRAEVAFECDLVCMSTHGRSGLSRWAFGSVTDKVLRGGRIPVMLVRAQDAEKTESE